MVLYLAMSSTYELSEADTKLSQFGPKGNIESYFICIITVIIG